LIDYVLVDDRQQTKGKPYLQGKAGVMPEFTDSEVITLVSNSLLSKRKPVCKNSENKPV
jgi:hypothetical protein